MLAWGRRGINLNASVWHLNVSRELLLDLRVIPAVKLVYLSAIEKDKNKINRDFFSSCVIEYSQQHRLYKRTIHERYMTVKFYRNRVEKI